MQDSNFLFNSLVASDVFSISETTALNEHVFMGGRINIYASDS